MKKILLLSASALLFTLFSCTADESETPAKNETVKNIKTQNPAYADGPGDITPPPPPPPTDE